MTSCIDEVPDLEIEIGHDLRTRELSWVSTRGLTWFGYPELVAPVPPGVLPGDQGALAVFLATALIALGRTMLGLRGFLDASEIPCYTDHLQDELVTVWVCGDDSPWLPVPADLLAEDMFLVECSLWSQPPV